MLYEEDMHVRLPLGVREALEVIATAKSSTASEELRKAVDAYIARHGLVIGPGGEVTRAATG